MTQRIAFFVSRALLIALLMAGCTAPDKGDSSLKFSFDHNGGTINGPFGVRMVIPMGATNTTCEGTMIFSKAAPAPKPAGTELTITAWLSLDAICDPLLEPATLIMPLKTSAADPKGAFSPEEGSSWTSIPALANDDGLVRMEISASGYYTFISEE